MDDLSSLAKKAKGRKCCMDRYCIRYNRKKQNKRRKENSRNRGTKTRARKRCFRNRINPINRHSKCAYFWN